MTPYKIKFTYMARDFAEAKCGGVAAVTEQVRGEIGEMLNDGMESINSLMFHVVTVNDTDFICSPSPNGDNTLLVDTASYSDLDDPLKDGPFKGMKISVPKGDSDD
jgi:hypothetical protein